METTRRIKVIRLCRAICHACIILMPVFVFFRLLLVFIGKAGNGISDLSVMRQFMFYFISIIRYGAFFYGLVQLRRLFGLYERDVFLTNENVVCFRGIAWALITAVVMNLDLTVVLMAPHDFIISFSYARTVNYTVISFLYLACNLLPGLLLLLISWTMDEGRLIKEEQEQFI